MTLPRFDLMAQLDRTPRGMTLSDLSKRMMVSNGNLTALVERLAQSGHLDHTTSTADRRAQIIRLTKIGQKSFRQMAAVHETWILSMFANLSNKDVEALMSPRDGRSVDRLGGPQAGRDRLLPCRKSCTISNSSRLRDSPCPVCRSRSAAARQDGPARSRALTIERGRAWRTAEAITSPIRFVLPPLVADVSVLQR